VIGTVWVRDTLTPAVLARGAAHRTSVFQDIVDCRFTEIDVAKQIKAANYDFESGLIGSRYTVRTKAGKQSGQQPAASC
jgi:hypothetical protein